MPRKKRLIFRICALFLTGVFCLQQLSFAQGLEPSVISPTPSLFEPPLQFVSLKEMHPGTNGSFIILMEDAHSNYSGQLNLANALEDIMTKYDISLVMSEGGADDCTLTPLKNIAPSAVWKKPAKSYLMEGKIAGEEYLNLISDHPMKIMGLEDISLYLKSLQNYAKLAEKREENLRYLTDIQEAVSKLKKKIYPEELREYEKTKTSNGERKTDSNFEKRFKALSELAQQVSLREGAQRRRSNLSNNIDDQIASGTTPPRNDTFAGFPEFAKLMRLQEREKAIDFNQANLEQAVIFEQLSKTSTDLKELLAQGNQAGQSKGPQFTLFQNILNIANEKNLVVSNYPHWLAYGDYLKEFTNLDLDKVLEEHEKFEDKTYENVIVSSRPPEAGPPSAESNPTGETTATLGNDALLVRAIDRYLSLLDSAYHIQMTTKEFEMFEQNEQDFSTLAYQAFVNRKLAELGYFQDLIPYEHSFEEDKQYLKAFYASVNDRDSAFLQNVKKYLDQEKQKTAVMIAGGYHTPHLKKLLMDQGYSVAILTPKVTSETNQARYERGLLEPMKKETKKVFVGLKEHRVHDKSLTTLDADLIKKPRKKTDGVRAASLGLAYFEETDPLELARMPEAEIDLRLSRIREQLAIARGLNGKIGFNQKTIQEFERRLEGVADRLKEDQNRAPLLPAVMQVSQAGASTAVISGARLANEKSTSTITSQAFWDIQIGSLIPSIQKVDDFNQYIALLEIVRELLFNTPPENMVQVLRNISGNNDIQMNQLERKIIVEYFDKGNHKYVFKVIVHLKNGNDVTFALAMKTEKGKYDITDNEVNDLRAITKIRRDIVPAFGGRGITADGRAWFMEEFIKGETAYALSEQNALTAKMRKAIITTLLMFATTLYGFAPKDSHPKNFIFKPSAETAKSDKAIIVDIGNRRLSLFAEKMPNYWHLTESQRQKSLAVQSRHRLLFLFGLLVNYGMISHPFQANTVSNQEANDFVFDAVIETLGKEKGTLFLKDAYDFATELKSQAKLDKFIYDNGPQLSSSLVGGRRGASLREDFIKPFTEYLLTELQNYLLKSDFRRGPPEQESTGTPAGARLAAPPLDSFKRLKLLGPSSELNVILVGESKGERYYVKIGKDSLSAERENRILLEMAAYPDLAEHLPSAASGTMTKKDISILNKHFPVYTTTIGIGSPYLVFPEIQGEKLEEWIRKIVTKELIISDQGFVLTFKRISQTLQKFHNKGITHRDLKPEEILIGNDGRIFLVDFGLATTTESPRETISPEHVMLANHTYVDASMEGPKRDWRSLLVIMFGAGLALPNESLIKKNLFQLGSVIRPKSITPRGDEILLYLDRLDKYLETRDPQMLAYPWSGARLAITPNEQAFESAANRFQQTVGQEGSRELFEDLKAKLQAVLAERNETRVFDVLKKYDQDPQLQVAHLLVLYDMTDPRGRRKVITYHNEHHFNELLDFADRVSVNFKNPVRAQKLLKLGMYLHDLGYFHSDQEAYASGHEDRSKKKVEEFAPILGLTAPEAAAVQYLIEKTKFKLVPFDRTRGLTPDPTQRTPEDFGNEVALDNRVYRNLEDSVRSTLSTETQTFIQTNFASTTDLGLVQDMIMAGKVIAVADVYAQDEFRPQMVVQVQSVHQHDDLVLGRGESGQPPAQAKSTRLELVSSSRFFLEVFTQQLRLDFILTGVDDQGNVAPVEETLKIRIPDDLKKDRIETLETMDRIGREIVVLKSTETNAGAKAEAEQYLNRFIIEGFEAGILDQIVADELTEEIRGFKRQGAGARLAGEARLGARSSELGAGKDEKVMNSERLVLFSGVVALTQGNIAEGEVQAVTADEETMTLLAEIYMLMQRNIPNKPIAFLIKKLGLNSRIQLTFVNGNPALQFQVVNGSNIGEPIVIEQRYLDEATLSIGNRKNGTVGQTVDVAGKLTTVDLALKAVEDFETMLGRMKDKDFMIPEATRVVKERKLLLQRQIPEGDGLSPKVLESWFKMQKAIDKKIKDAASEIKIEVYVQYISLKNQVNTENSDTVKDDFRETAKVMRVGELSTEFLRNAKGLGVIVTDERISKDGQFNLLPDGPIGVMAIMVAFAGDLFDTNKIEMTLSGYTAGYQYDNLGLLKEVKEDAQVDSYRLKGLVIQKIKAIAYSVVLAVQRLMEKAVGSAA